MERLKNIVLVLLLVALIISICFNVHHSTTEPGEVYRDTIRTTFVDTIPYYQPVANDSSVIGHVTDRLPISVPKMPESVPNLRENAENGGESVPKIGKEDNFPTKDHIADASNMVAHLTNEASKTDSTDVVIPITQKVYEDSTYTAYVSGYRANLDSLIIYPKYEVVNITSHPKPKRWSVGLQVGYGMTMKGTPQFVPYVGVGISYNLFSF